MRIALLLGLLGCSSAPLIAPLELAEARDVFNAGASGPRMIVFFSSGCAACDTGSQALQETLQTTSGPITVLAVPHPGSPPQARTRTDDTGIMYDTVALFRRGARWEATLPAPDYLEVGLEAILPDVKNQLLMLLK